MTARGTAAWGQLEEADRRLYALNNALSALEYREDQGDTTASPDIVAVRQRIGALLCDPDLRVSARTCREEASTYGDQKLKQKAQLLEQEIVFSSIENNAQLLRAKDAVRKKAGAFDLGRVMRMLGHEPDRSARRQAYEALAQATATTANACRKLLRLYNELAHMEGYLDYAEAKLGYEGLTVEELYRLFGKWHDQLRPRWERALAETARGIGDTVRAHDLLFMLRARCEGPLEVFAQGQGPVFLQELVRHMGTNLDKLPVSIERRELPFVGACYRVRPGEDVRIVLNQRLSGFQEHFYLLHEFGHAIYYCFCPVGSELLLDNHLSREIMADVWPHFLKDRAVLSQLIGLSTQRIDALIEAQRERESLSLFLLMRDAVFTVEALRNPHAPFAELWRSVSRAWLGIDDDSGAYELGDFLHPLDMKSYVFAQVLSERAFASLSPSGSGALEQLVERFYRPGATVDWRHKFALGRGEGAH